MSNPTLSQSQSEELAPTPSIRKMARTPMLSRVADSMYWIGRYIERAENISRLLDVMLQLVLDYEPLGEAQFTATWEPIVQAAGDQEQFFKLYPVADEASVSAFLTMDRRNANSIVSCVNAARENARMIRDQISGEMWEMINDLYLDLKKQDVESLGHSELAHFLARVRTGSHLFQGLTEATFFHEEGYRFLNVGKYLERADQTSRMLDIKYHIIMPEGQEVGGALDASQWIAVLRACSAFESYHRIYVADVLPWKVAEFLLLAPTFPRSLHFCLRTAGYHLRAISETAEGHFTNEAEKLLGRLSAEITYCDIGDIFREGLHEFIDRVQKRLLKLNKAVFETYLFYPEVDLAEELNRHGVKQEG